MLKCPKKVVTDQNIGFSVDVTNLMLAALARGIWSATSLRRWAAPAQLHKHGPDKSNRPVMGPITARRQHHHSPATICKRKERTIKEKENQTQRSEKSSSMRKGKKVKRKENRTQSEEESPLMEKQKEKGKEKEKQYWLLKTEPGEWSWEDQAENEGVSKWDGVKNKQAQKNLKSMKLGDLGFFYHSGAKARRVVGVVEVTREWYSEGDDEAVVDVKAVGEMRKAVDLSEMKGDERMKGFALLRQPRLSVVPVPEDVWERICELGGGFEGDGKEVDDDNDGKD